MKKSFSTLSALYLFFSLTIFNHALANNSARSCYLPDEEDPIYCFKANKNLDSSLFDDSESQIDWFEGSFEDLLNEAKKTQKPIFTDFYADWCGPCQYMIKYVFTDVEVANYLNENFIPFKTQSDDSEGKRLFDLYNVRAVPTFIFFSPEGEVIERVLGSRNKEDFLTLLKDVVTKDTTPLPQLQ